MGQARVGCGCEVSGRGFLGLAYALDCDKTSGTHFAIPVSSVLFIKGTPGTGVTCITYRLDGQTSPTAVQVAHDYSDVLEWVQI